MECGFYSSCIVADKILKHNTIGRKLYEDFFNDRLTGPTSIWATMKLRKLKMFRSQDKTVKSKIPGKVIQLKEEKTLLSRFLITARKRPELDLEYSLGNFEFAVVL